MRKHRRLCWRSHRSYRLVVLLRFLRQPIPVVAAIILLLIIFAAIGANFIAPDDPFQTKVARRLAAIGTPGRWLGGDELGRDILSRLIYGGRVSLTMAIVPVAIGLFVGGFLGILAGYAGGRINMAIMRGMDVFYAFPSILLAVAIAGALGPGLRNGIIALSLVFIPPIARMAESVTTQVRAYEFVIAARLSGASTSPHHARAHPQQCRRTDPRLRVEPGQRVDHRRLRPELPRPRRRAAEGGLGPDALGAAPVDLCQSLGRGAAGRDDLHLLDVLQSGQRRHPPFDGGAPMSTDFARAEAPLPPIVDRGGPMQPLLTATGLRKWFKLSDGLFGSRTVVRAVDDLSLTVNKGETVGIVGESGCGKSTAARLISGITPADGGRIVFDGEMFWTPKRRITAERRRAIQMVFQDSASSLNPRMTITETLAFGPRAHGVPTGQARSYARDLLAAVGLPPSRFAERYPVQLSGGQRQRVNIARAVAMRPRLLVLDEPVSALDKSVEAQVLNLLVRMREELGLSYIFISHDLNVVRYISDRVVVMYLGQVVEEATSEDMFSAPKHPYTRALFASKPSFDPRNRVRAAPLTGDPPDPINPPSGCRFRTRCPIAEQVCANAKPPLEAGGMACPITRSPVGPQAPGSGHSLAPKLLEAVQ